jgi:dGTPase
LKNHIGDIRNRSIDVQIMDLADEIAYAAHDLEDAISFGFVTIAEMMYEFDISDKYNSVAQEFKDLARDSQKVALEARRLNTSEEYSFLIKKELTSNIVDKLMRDIGITNQDGSEEIGYTNLRELSEGLKKLVFKAIQRKKDIQLYEKQGERVINGLFEVYTDQKFNKNLILLPPEFRAIANQERNQCDHESMQKRAVIDYIAGMMDSFAIQEYKKYFGSSALDHTYDRETWRK